MSFQDHIIRGDINKFLADLKQGPHPRLFEGLIQCVVTSPPYLGQRVYGDNTHEMGLEPTAAEYVLNLAGTFESLKWLMVPGGSLWINMGDKYNGSGGAGGDWDGAGGPRKFMDPAYPVRSLLSIPGLFAKEMTRRGFIFRSDVIWDKGRDKPESLSHVKRPRVAHEHIMLFEVPGAPPKFFPDALKETGSVWHFPPGGNGPKGHLAPFPDELVERCILASTTPNDVVFDPFAGSGTVIRVALNWRRQAFGMELYD